MLSNPTFWTVAVGCAMLGAVCGLLGCLTFLRRQSLLGDTLAHAALPGVCATFAVGWQLQRAGWDVDPKSPLVLLPGALLSSLLGALWMLGIVRGTRLKEDAALAIVLSVFYGAGIVGLTALQSVGSANQAGLDKFLFGSAAALLSQDLRTIAVLGAVVLAGLALFFKELKLITFDPMFAAAGGWPVTGLEVLLTVLVAVAVVIGLQAVGVVLVAAMLILPAAAARQWTDSLARMLALAAGIGAFAGVAGAVISSAAAKIPTGPVVVLAATAVLGTSLLLAPGRGLIWRQWQLLRWRRKVADENLLADLYRLGERDATAAEIGWPVSRVAAVRGQPIGPVSARLARLATRGLVAESAATAGGSTAGGSTAGEATWHLTDAGRAEATRIVRNHRLWELFLSRRMDLPADHVHRDAEDMEHTLSPELVAELEGLLDRPTADPHGRAIPPVKPA